MSSLPVTYEMVRHSAEINTYIQQAEASPSTPLPT